MSANTLGWARLCLLLGLLGSEACGPSLPPSVVLITLDTTRPDHLGCYGYAKATSPSLDLFAEAAVLYENAYATSSWTLPSHASLFTGLLPMQHGAQSVPEASNRSLGYGVRPLPESATTLAELLGDAGYRTAAVVGGPALRSELGVAQGFESYRDELPQLTGKRAQQVTKEATALVKGFGTEPYFLFVNFFDPHSPYRPPPPFDEGLPPSANKGLGKALVEQLIDGVSPRPTSELEPSLQAALSTMVARYDAEITYMDHHLGRLLKAISEAPRGDRTLIVITGDHGESFGEHYFVSHGAHLYEHNVRVPLLIRYPDRGAERVSPPVQNHRVFAAILTAAGLAMPRDVTLHDLSETDGTIVNQVQRTDSNVRLFGRFFDRDLWAILDPPYKLIKSTTGKLEVFDLKADPSELRNLVASEPELTANLLRRLETISMEKPPLFDEKSRAVLRLETEEALRALGYID